VASFVWMTSGRADLQPNALTAFAWRARILSQKAPRNVSRLWPGRVSGGPTVFWRTTDRRSQLDQVAFSRQSNQALDQRRGPPPA